MRLLPRAGSKQTEIDGAGSKGMSGARRKTERTPLEVAVGLLSRREHSARELKRKLEARGIEPPEADAALERLQKAGLQDEQRFAESLLRQRVMAGYGPYYLRAELATHGLAESLIDQLIEQLTEAGEIDWTAVAADLIERRFAAGLSDPKQRRRAQSLLHRRGFDAETARLVLG